MNTSFRPAWDAGRGARWEVSRENTRHHVPILGWGGGWGDGAHLETESGIDAPSVFGDKA